MKNDDNVKNVLKDDGVSNSLLDRGHDFENIETTSIEFLEKKLNYKDGDSWAVRVIYNELFGGVILSLATETNKQYISVPADIAVFKVKVLPVAV